MAGGGMKARAPKRKCDKNGCHKARSRNGFIIFFMRLLKCMPTACVTRVAQIAGRKWQKMPKDEKCKFLKLARKGSPKKSNRRRRKNNSCRSGCRSS